MKRMVLILGALVVGSALVGCGESSSQDAKRTVTVQGSVSSGLSVDNGRAVAIGRNGRKFWAYLDRQGDFTLRLPVGQSYRILVASQREDGGQAVVGHLVLGASKTQWLGANSEGVVNLGTLRAATTAETAGSVTTKTYGSDEGDEKAETTDKGDYDDDSANHDDDNECHEDDDGGAKPEGDYEKDGDLEKDGPKDEGTGKGKSVDEDDECKVCSEGNEKELEPSKKPSKKWEDKDTSSEGDGDYEDKKPCPKKSSSSSTGDKSPDAPSKEPSGDTYPDKEGSDSADASGEDKTSSDGSTTTSGTKPSGDKCALSKECTSTCACIASKCVTK